jgi:hypothetical protein
MIEFGVSWLNLVSNIAIKSSLIREWSVICCVKKFASAAEKQLP